MRNPAPTPLIRFLRSLADKLESGGLILDQFNDFSPCQTGALEFDADADIVQKCFSFDLYVSNKGTQ